jgi:hypothetical protein
VGEEASFRARRAVHCNGVGNDPVNGVPVVTSGICHNVPSKVAPSQFVAVLGTWGGHQAGRLAKSVLFLGVFDLFGSTARVLPTMTTKTTDWTFGGLRPFEPRWFETSTGG